MLKFYEPDREWFAQVYVIELAKIGTIDATEKFPCVWTWTEKGIKRVQILNSESHLASETSSDTEKKSSI